MGHNMLMLYCEDCVKVDNYPYFGYMRPTYTEAELRELDDYADALGIEMIPCIQTLAHLTDGLRWRCFHGIRDYESCLLVGKQETYDFIRNLLSSASRPFRSRRIHIGMDEAWKLGRGKYLDLNGHRPTHEIMTEHLARVMEIINELGLEPMMWDDMFFRAVCNGSYYDMEGDVPDEVADIVPDGMSCVYWDYYHDTVEEYSKNLAQHFKLTDRLVFAGGCRTWRSFGLTWSKTLRTSAAALAACRQNGVKEVFMTTWGDNGVEAPATLNLIGCQLFAELGYTEEYDEEKFARRFKFCTGGELADFANLELLDVNEWISEQRPGETHSYNTSKTMMWQDILTGLLDKNYEGSNLQAHYERVAPILKEAIGRNGQFDPEFEMSYLVARVLSLKAEMGQRLTAAYRAGDKDTLTRIANEDLPDLVI